MRSLEVNLNAITPDGYIRDRMDDGPLAVGETVRVWTDDIETTAQVMRVNPDNGLVYLALDWDGLHDIENV